MRCPLIVALSYNNNSVLHRDLILGRCGENTPALELPNMLYRQFPHEDSLGADHRLKFHPLPDVPQFHFPGSFQVVLNIGKHSGKVIQIRNDLGSIDLFCVNILTATA